MASLLFRAHPGVLDRAGRDSFTVQEATESLSPFVCRGEGGRGGTGQGGGEGQRDGEEEEEMEAGRSWWEREEESSGAQSGA